MQTSIHTISETAANALALGKTYKTTFLLAENRRRDDHVLITRAYVYFFSEQKCYVVTLFVCINLTLLLRKSCSEHIIIIIFILSLISTKCSVDYK